MPESSPQPGDTVVPAHPLAGKVVARDVRGGKPGCLVTWPGLPPVWFADSDAGLRVITPAPTT